MDTVMQDFNNRERRWILRGMGVLATVGASIGFYSGWQQGISLALVGAILFGCFLVGWLTIYWVLIVQCLELKDTDSRR